MTTKPQKKAAPKQRRKAQRAPVSRVECEIRVLGKAPEAVHGALMRDIGAGGTLITMEVDLSIGQLVLCNFKLPSGGKHSLHGTVRRCMNRPGAETFDVAVEFSATQSSEKELMSWVLSWIALQQRATV